MSPKNASRFWLSLAVTATWLITPSGKADESKTRKIQSLQVSDTSVTEILKHLGAQLEHGTSSKQIASYENLFNRTDPNQDGKHSKREYVEQGRYLTPRARAGIFQAADENADDFVTRDEYVLNRIITDEAKSLIQGMDHSKDGLVDRAEFVNRTIDQLSDPKLANQVFSALDTNENGQITIPEYLQVWGRWARSGQPTAATRIIARKEKLKDATSKCQSTPPK
ncbi:MAG: hypothetical protein GY768_22680 [Planctomycetaceae bacterium]|nr:hypothetical protein [Planctomycetaceae bacterium]